MIRSSSSPRLNDGLPIRIVGGKFTNSGRWCVMAAVALIAATPSFSIDQAKAESKVDEAIAKYGVTGKNAIVAIIDRGIDWKNADFRNPDGTTRIEYIFDLSDDSGASAPGNTYGRGTIYTKTQIDAALASGGPLNTRDAVGHGTATAATAAGGGRNDARYRGVAPEARLIVVKFTSEGAIAHDGEPAEAAFYDPAAFPVAVDFVIDKAAELDLPVVMLANFGRTGGPGDGTSLLARTVDEAVGPGKPGIVFVTGSSNDGDGNINNHAGSTLAQDETKTIGIEKVAAGPMVFDLWYAETDRFTVRVITPDGTFGPYAAPAGPTAAADQTGTGFNLFHRGRDRESTMSTNTKRLLYIQFTGAPGTYQVELTGTSVTGDGRFDAALSPSAYADGTPVNHFTNYAAPGTIWEMAAAQNNICPNAYINWKDYVDIDGNNRSKTPPQEIGELWFGSGVGPTWDGRRGIDVSAPGHVVVTTYNPTSYWATLRGNLVPSAAGVYGTAGGASPIVTGIVALMLDMDPTLDAAEVKQILHETAMADAFTGAVPNTRWGYGKVNALGALDRVNELQPLAITTPPTPATTTAGGPTTLTVDAEGGGTLAYQWQFKANGAADFSDISGATNATYTIPSTQEFQQGEYRVRVLSGGTSGASVLSSPVTVTVTAPGPSLSRLLNLSTRGLSLTGDDLLIPGFAIQGTGTKRLLIRAVGPTLADLGVSGALMDPQMVLKRFENGAYVDVASNDNWGTNSNVGEIISTSERLFAFDLSTGSADAALLMDLSPGQYTVVTSGVNNATGVAIVELYDDDGATPSARMTSISNRGFVDVGDKVMIPGIVVSSGGTKTVLIRVAGPTLATLGVTGVLEDPVLTLVNGNNQIIVTNDDWNSDATMADQVRTVGASVFAFALDEGSADAAVVVTLTPGLYTAIASGANGTTGVALVEVYEVP